MYCGYTGNICSSTNRLSRNMMEVKYSFEAPAALPQEDTSVPNLQADVWAPQLVMIFWRRKYIISRTDTRSPNLPPRKVVDMPNTLIRME
jgi:hypothetical protein